MSAEQPLQPASVNPHRALMILCTVTSGFVMFGLFAGWQWYFQHKERRDAILRFAQKKESEVKQQIASMNDQTVTAVPPPPSDASPRVSLTDMAKGGDSGTEGEVHSEPITITLPLDPRSPDVQQADALLQQFWKAKSWKDKIEFVYEPDRTRSLMEQFYEKQKGSEPISGALLNRGHYRLNGTEILHFTYSCNRPGDVLELAMRRSAGGRFVLDWESYVGYGEMTWQDFKRERPAHPTLFRAFATLSDYYNYEFTDRDKFMSVNLLSPDGLVSLHGFCERKSPVANALTRSLSRINSMTGIVVKVAFPDRAESDHCVWMKQFVSDRWLLLP